MCGKSRIPKALLEYRLKSQYSRTETRIISPGGCRDLRKDMGRSRFLGVYIDGHCRFDPIRRRQNGRRRPIEEFHVMSDTIKIKRPLCCRRQEDLGGREKQDSLGNTIKVRTRVHDSEDDVSDSLLELTDNLAKGPTR